MDSALDEIEFLVRSEHRVAAVGALAERPRSRAALRRATGASSSTVGRLLREFESRGWVVRDGGEYRMTTEGEFVAEEVTSLLDRMETRQQLRDVARWLPTEKLGITIEAFSEAVVTVVDEAEPYRPVRRYDALMEDAEAMRAFGTPTLKSANAGALFRNVRAGMDTEIIYPTPIVEAVLEWSPEAAEEGLASGNLTIMLHDGLPCGLTVFDDRVALTGYDPDTGMLRAIVDTDAAEAREWATELYDTYREEARPLDAEAVEVDSGAT
ncbi:MULTISPECIES: winged helix-turn-helix domain-containing protein [Halorussus]|uniref:helix-turn-helix transcriptional regulator n=1 Tax=Halorussus TaxID=1070314 RepID=UPI000E20CC74|nr:MULTISPECIES: helix-turn-helix domain-containing protein [Halorussus]NHN59353.1 transcriptional regulator [Halorussus sp. JP-T4]